MIEQTAPKNRSGSRPAAAALFLTPERVWRLAPRRALAASGLCWAGFALVCLAVLTGHAGALDEAGLVFWRDGPLLLPRGPIWLLEAVRDVTALGGVVLRYAIAGAVAAALYALALRRDAVVLVTTVVSGWGVEAALKLLVGRSRPTIVPHLTEAGGASFPSGHSFNAALVYLALALTLAGLCHRPTSRAALIVGSMVLSLAIAFSRVWLGVHFPSDVLAGWLGGTAWAFTAVALLDRPAQIFSAQA